MPLAAPTAPVAAQEWPRSVLDMQRTRLLAAAVDVVDEHGYDGMTVARVTARARVSRRTFYDLFADREDCFLAVYRHAIDRASRLAVAAYAEPGAWREKVRLALAALLAAMDEEPALARLCVVDALGAGRRVLADRQRTLEALGGVIDEGRAQARTRTQPPPLVAEGLVGAALSLVHTRLLAESRRPCGELLNPLMSLIVLPYLGAAAAARELERPVASAASTPRDRAGNPFEGLRMRLTYRTLSVLGVISTHPGASNRQIAEAAGIHDQGQISKLLARLHGLGLIANDGRGHAKGEPNAWRLTTRGGDVARSMRPGAAAG